MHAVRIQTNHTDERVLACVMNVEKRARDILKPFVASMLKTAFEVS